MKKILFLILAVALSGVAFSQDLIVTNSGDSINCKITQIKSGDIYFKFMRDGKVDDTILPTDGVRDYQFNFYESPVLPEKEISFAHDYSRVRIALNIGLSQRIAKIPDDLPEELKEYTRKLKSGYTFGADFHYYLTENVGVGGKVYSSKYSNKVSIKATDESGNIKIGDMSDKINILFAGPSVSYRLFNKKKTNAFIYNFAVGYLGYKNNVTFFDKFKVTGGTVGLAIDFGYDFRLGSNKAIGLQLSMVQGVLTKFKREINGKTETIKLEKEKYEGLGRIDFTIGYRVNL